MAKYLVLLCALVIIPITSQAQIYRGSSIIYAEYFINNDLGEGRCTPIPIIPITPDTTEVSLNIDSLHLREGDVVYIRVRNENGLWSTPKGVKFRGYGEKRGSKIEQAEYFIGDDPGEGHGTPIPVGISATVSIVANNIELTSDTDIVYIRVKDSNGRWSIPTGRKRIIRTISGAEYYIRRGTTKTLPGDTLYPADGAFDEIVETAYRDSIRLVGGFRPGYDTVFVKFKSNERVWGAAGYSTYPVPSFISRRISIPETTATTATISWDNAQYAEGYSVRINDGPVRNLRGTNMELTDLTPNTPYNCWVWAYNSIGTSDTLFISFRTLLPTPSLVSPGDSSCIGTTSPIRFEWNSVGITGITYRVTIQRETGETYYTDTTSETNITLRLDEGNYIWFVSCFTPLNYSHLSTIRHLYVDGTPPRVLTLVAREQGTSGTATNPSPWSRTGNFEILWEIAPGEVSGLREIWVRQGISPTSREDAEFILSESTRTINLRDDGVFTYYFVFVDRVGNYGDAQTLVLRKDSGRPTPANPILPRASYPGYVPVSWEGGYDSLSGIKKYKIIRRVSGASVWDTVGAYNNTDAPVRVEFRNRTDYEVAVVPQDSAGNTAEASIADTITIIPDLGMTPSDIKFGPEAPPITVRWHGIGTVPGGALFGVNFYSSPTGGSVLRTYSVSDTFFTINADISSILHRDGEYGFNVSIIYLARNDTLRPTSYGRLLYDGTAPGSPVNLRINRTYRISPWSSSTRFEVSWSNPFDLSGIWKAYYKVATRPPRDGTDTTGSWIITTSSPSFELTINSEGRNNIYVWLVDSAYNNGIEGVDYVTARIDTTPPPDPIAYFVDSSAIRIPGTDSVQIKACWNPVVDNLSGLMEYRYKTWRYSPPSNYRTTLDTCVTIRTRIDSCNIEVISVDSAGNTLGFSGAEDYYTNVKENNPILPKEYSMSIAPNPFNAMLNISYAIPISSDVEIQVYDIMGHKVATILKEYKEPGYYTFQWRTQQNISSGLYFIMLQAGNQTIVKRALLIK